MKRNANAAESSQHSAQKPEKAARLETAGLLIISALLLLYAVIRYWHNIPWSLR